MSLFNSYCMKKVCYLLFIILLASCSGNRKGACKILQTGVVTGKIIDSKTDNFVIIDDKDSIKYNGVYPRQPILLFRKARQSNVEIGDTASVIDCNGNVILAKASHVQPAITDYIHEQRIGWEDIIIIIMMPILLLLILLTNAIAYVVSEMVSEVIGDTIGLFVYVLLFIIAIVGVVGISCILLSDINILLSR